MMEEPVCLISTTVRYLDNNNLKNKNELKTKHVY